MALAGVQYEPVSLNVNEDCFEEERVPNMDEKSRKNQNVIKRCDSGK